MNAIAVGDSLEVQDACGEWHRAIAASGIEGTHEYVDGHARKVHDFPVVWVEVKGRNGQMCTLPWPVNGFVRAT